MGVGIESQILVAIISGVLSGPMLTILISKKKEQGLYPKHPEARSRRLLGKWKGCLEQDNPKDISVRLETNLEMNFNRKGKIIKGQGKFHDPNEGQSIDVNLYNGMFDGNILKIDYENKEKHIFQKGTTILEMGTKGSFLSGAFIGYSPGIDKVITGIVKLEK